MTKGPNAVVKGIPIIGAFSGHAIEWFSPWTTNGTDTLILYPDNCDEAFPAIIFTSSPTIPLVSWSFLRCCHRIFLIFQEVSMTGGVSIVWKQFLLQIL